MTIYDTDGIHRVVTGGTVEVAPSENTYVGDCTQCASPLYVEDRKGQDMYHCYNCRADIHVSAEG